MPGLSQHDLAGTTLDSYEVKSLLGQGAMGAVYEARDTKLDRRVALKVMAPEIAEDPRYRRHFRQEIDVAAGVDHPNVVPVHAASYTPPHFYIVMQLVDGLDLGRAVDDGRRLEEVHAMRIVGQIASALHAVHERGLVHRDVKPQNILMFHFALEDEHSFLSDFGIARATSDNSGPGGTRGYMAPEVLAGEPATPASDQYSLGCVAYKLLSGQLPTDPEVASLPGAHLTGGVPSLGRVAANVSDRVLEAVDMALREDPLARHPSVREIARAAKAGEDEFARSQHIQSLVREARDTSEAIERLRSEERMTDARIEQILDRTRESRRRGLEAKRRLRRPVWRRD